MGKSIKSGIQLQARYNGSSMITCRNMYMEKTIGEKSWNLQISQEGFSILRLGRFRLSVTRFLMSRIVSYSYTCICIYMHMYALLLYICIHKHVYTCICAYIYTLPQNYICYCFATCFFYSEIHHDIDSLKQYLVIAGNEPITMLQALEYSYIESFHVNLSISFFLITKPNFVVESFVLFHSISFWQQVL